MMAFITNKYHSVKIPYEQDLLEWLQETYPYSEYRKVEAA